VQAALVTTRGARERAGIARLVESIRPGLEGLDETLPPAERLDAAVEANVRWSMQQVLETPEAQARVKEGVLKLVGAVYELETGRVRFL
jgi:carbonic anhydrase